MQVQALEQVQVQALEQVQVQALVCDVNASRGRWTVRAIYFPLARHTARNKTQQ